MISAKQAREQSDENKIRLRRAEIEKAIKNDSKKAKNKKHL